MITKLFNLSLTHVEVEDPNPPKAGVDVAGCVLAPKRPVVAGAPNRLPPAAGAAPNALPPNAGVCCCCC